MKYLLASSLLLFSLGCFAAIYMQTNPNGNVIYSDSPESNARAVALPSSNAAISLPSIQNKINQTNSAAADNTAQQQSTKEYSQFILISPTNQQTFQNTRDIQVILQVEPTLREGDRVQVFLDDVPAGPATNDLSQLYIHNIDRGEHTIYAAIIDNSGHVLNKVDPITVYIHYSALPTGSGGLVPTNNANGVTPSSPGSGVTPPASQGSGIVPPGGSGIVPSGSGNGQVPSTSGGSGIVPSPKSGPPIY